MPKPTDIPLWSTAPGTTIDPGPTRQSTGFLPGKLLPSKWLNWLLNRQGAWFQYLRDLHIEPEFLNKQYEWYGPQGFHGPTLGFYQNPVLCGTNNEFGYANSAGVAQKRPRKNVIPLNQFFPEIGHSLEDEWQGRWWTRQNTVTTTYPSTVPSGVSSAPWYTLYSNRFLVGEFTLPDGAVLTGYRIGINTPATSGAINVQVGRVLMGEAYAFFGAPPNMNVDTYLLSTDHALPISDLVIERTLSSTEQSEYGLSVPSLSHFTLRIRSAFPANPSGTTGGPSPLQVNWVQVQWLDPGPRNH